MSILLLAVTLAPSAGQKMYNIPKVMVKRGQFSDLKQADPGIPGPVEEEVFTKKTDRNK